MSEFLAENMAAVLWVLATVVLCVIEASTVNLVCIWFALGAFAAALAAAFGVGLMAQIILFVAVSALSLLLLRRFTKGVLKVKKTPTNADSVVGQRGVVVEDIDNTAETGRVFVGGLDWTARSRDGSRVHTGETVQIEAIQGVKVLVRPVKEKEE